MKILYFPSNILHLFFNYHLNLNKFVKIKLFQNLFKFLKYRYPLNGEYIHTGEISKVIGKENFFIVDGLDDVYLENNYLNFKKFATIDGYPDLFNHEKPRFIKFNDLNNIINNIDLIIFSAQCNQKFLSFIRKYKNKIPIIMIDKKDHPEVYETNQDLLRGHNRNDFDIFIKQDLPLKDKHDFIYPICPLPTQEIKKKEQREKVYNFSFIGKFWWKERNDRNEICDLINKNFKDNKIINTYGKKTFLDNRELEEILSRTKIILSPQGIVWDTYRHTNLAHYGSPILLPAKDCKTVGPDFVDMQNCIMYNTKLINKKYHIVDKEKLTKKLNDLLNNNDLLYYIYKNYKETINKGHLRIHRSNYIVDLGKKVINGSIKV